MRDETLLLRQVHPCFLDNGEVTSQAFFPFPKDRGQLSVDNGDLTDPAAAYVLHTKVRKLESAGTWGVVCSEVAGMGLACRADPVEGNDAHALIDFGSLDEKACRKMARRLKACANARGRLYPVY